MKIRSDILRTYQSIHTWTGIIAGLVLFIGFYAGSLTMFKPQIEQWASPPAQHLPQVPTEHLDQLVEKSLSQYDNAQQGFIINFDEHKSPMSWYESGGGRGIRLDDSLMHASLSDSGSLITQTSGTNELGNLIDQLHRTAGIMGKVGHEDLGVLILGVAALLYFLALVSGVIFLLPTLTKSLFALRKNKGANRFWLDSHNLVGVLSLPFHLIIAWTVVVFAFHDLFYGGLSIIYGDKPLFEPREKSTIEYSVADLPSINHYMDTVYQQVDGYTISSLDFSKLSSTSPAVAIELVSDTQMMRGGFSDFIYMNPYTFEIQYSTIPNSDDGAYGPIVNSFFSLHFGNYAGNLGRWLYFAMGLLGAFLFYSGNLLWLEKRRQKQQDQTKASKVMSALTIGVALGSMLGVSLAMLSSKWLYLLNFEINNHYLIIYYTSFLLAIGYSFIRGAALSAIHLLYLLTLSCLLIPLTSLMSSVIPGLWPASSLSGLTIELMALLFAAAFYFTAKKTKHRAYFGERNSIWALETLKPEKTEIRIKEVLVE